MEGLIIGGLTFLLIGIFHPIVIYAEYYFGKKVSILFFILGLISSYISYRLENIFLSIFMGILTCCFFWSIKEISDQEKRVLRGYFKENPKRKDYYNKLRERRRNL